MANIEFIDRPMLENETFKGCPMIIKTRVRKDERPGKSSEAEKGDFKITSGPTITYKAGNVTCQRDDNGKVSYEIVNKSEAEADKSHQVKSAEPEK